MVQEKTPGTWSAIQLFLLHKKGNKKDPLNYRGIALINSICKIFTQIIYKRMETYYDENNVNEFQMGFRKNRSTMDNIFSLTSICHLNLRHQKQKVYAMFVDLKRAFDSINQIILWEKLY